MADKLMVILKNNQGVVEIPLADPANFNMSIFANSVAGAKGIIFENVWIPSDNILLVGRGDVKVQPPPAKSGKLN